MNHSNELYSFLVIISKLIVNFGQILGHFWPLLWPQIPKMSLYETRTFVPFFGCGFSQKMNLSNALYSFLVIFSPLIVNFGQIFCHFWPPLWPKVLKRSVYEAGPLVPFSGCCFSQKTNLSNGLFSFLVIFSPLIVDFMSLTPFFVAILANFGHF